jgi:hypothetical protein
LRQSLWEIEEQIEEQDDRHEVSSANGTSRRKSKKENGTCLEKSMLELNLGIDLGSTVCVRSPDCWRLG